MSNHKYHDPDYPYDEPWWPGVTPGHPHYGRALQLSLFARDIRRGPALLMGPRKLAYRQRCIDNWRHYLAHGAPPA